MTEGGPTMNRAIDYTAGGVGMAIPAWFTLSNLTGAANLTLAVLSAAFLIWRWRREARREMKDGDDGR